jgi:hypothetical protein
VLWRAKASALPIRRATPIHTSFILDEWHEVHVALAPADEDPLARVAAGIRLLQDIEQVAALDVEDEPTPTKEPIENGHLTAAGF